MRAVSYRLRRRKINEDSSVPLMVWAAVTAQVTAQIKLHKMKRMPHRVSLVNGKTFALNLPEGAYGRTAWDQADPKTSLMVFLKGVKFRGRPVDILGFGSNGFLLTDDYAGVIYYIYEKQ